MSNTTVIPEHNTSADIGTKKASCLSPQEAANAKEKAPHPVLHGQTHTAERLSTKLDNDDLQEE